MHPALPTIYCPNPKCRTANRGELRFCQSCGGTLPQRYLWVASDSTPTPQMDNLLLDRYLFCGPRVVLDTQPGLPLGNVFELDKSIIPYLRLFPQRIHVPQIYSLSLLEPDGPILVLLEGAPLTPEDFSSGDSLTFAQKMGAVAAEPLIQSWPKASLLRKLNWLWQITKLWMPLFREKVASSLLDVNRLRVEGSLLRLLQLTPDPEGQPLTLADLGAFWQQHCSFSEDAIQPAFTTLCDRLIQGEITTIAPLKQTLEEWLSQEQQSYHVQIDITTRTDTGPLREHNEDACYPTHNTLVQDTSDTLAIVCDGVGGHASGEVASATAIAALTDHLQPLLTKTLAVDDLMFELERAVDSANDLITQQNDAEQRQDRDRMGTTVVMALYKEQNLYLTNVGDSRAYLVTTQGCYQATVDDDIASREVRLGYLPYREAQRQPGAGALIQALGMVPSSMLHPSVERFFLDSDCLFLLCSDGLSDFERVEVLWQEALLPILKGTKTLVESSQQLVQWANQLNGYDNVTVALMHCRVVKGTPSSTPSSPATALQARTQLQPKTKIASERSPQSRSTQPWLWFLIGFLGVFSIGAVLGWFLLKNRSTPISDPMAPSPPPLPTVTTGNELIIPSAMTLEANKFYIVKPQTIIGGASTPAPILLKEEGKVTAANLGILPQESIFKVMKFWRESNEQGGENWVQLQVCKVPPPAKPVDGGTTSPPATSQPKPLAEGIQGYLQSNLLTGQIQPIAPDELQKAEAEGCQLTASDNAGPG
jgi:protein phosphatase